MKKLNPRRRVRRAKAVRTAPADELERAEVAPHEAKAAFEGAPLIEAGKLLTPEEADRSAEAIDRRDRTSTSHLALVLNLAVLMAAASYVFFTAPNHLALGGASGLSIVVAALVPGLPQATALWVISIICVAAGLLLLDRKAVVWSVLASLALSAYVSLLQGLFPLAGSITGDLWIDLLCAVILTAVSAALAYSVGAATGGTDIIISAVAKRTSLTTGNATMLVNAASVIGGLALFDRHTGIYCVVGMPIVTVVVNAVLDGLKQHKVVTVICKQPARVEEFICRELCRTATVSQGWGAYSGNAVTPIMTVLNPRETLQLERHVRSLDPEAFITYVNTSQITGRGFRWV